MHTLNILGFTAGLLIAWLPNGLIHTGARQVNPDATLPASVLLETVRVSTAAMVQL